MKTIENSNRMIAEFMEISIDKTGSGNPSEWIYLMPQEYCTKYQSTYIHEMKFHTAWDWLMPVVEKIESIIFDEDNSFNVTIGSTNYCVIQDSNGEVYESIEDYADSKFETVYKSVVKFIEWYNQNK